MFLLPDGELLLCESLGAQHQGPQALVGKLLHKSNKKIINRIISSLLHYAQQCCGTLNYDTYLLYEL
jgi:hypothetical protein